MRKNLLRANALMLTFFPQTALAHFETTHQPFWHEPVHWLFQHYLVITLVGFGLIGIVTYLKYSSEKE